MTRDQCKWYWKGFDDAKAKLEQRSANEYGEPVNEVVDAINGAFKCVFTKVLSVGTKLYTTSPQRKEPEQKPVALGANIQLALTHLEGIKLRPWHSLTKSRAELAIAVLNRNTTPPPQRTAAEGEDTRRAWEGLSVFEINDLVTNTEHGLHELVERTEKLLKEKNT